MRNQFLARLREMVDEWHAGDIDCATFDGHRRATWDAIHRAGPDVEDAVLRTVCDQLPTILPGRGQDRLSRHAHRLAHARRMMTSAAWTRADVKHSDDTDVTTSDPLIAGVNDAEAI
jgi:hypothetical protein